MVNHTSRKKKGLYGRMKLFAGTSCIDLAQQVAVYLNVPLGRQDIILFPNDNLFVRLHESVRGEDVYVIQTTSRPVHRNLMELLIMLQTYRLDSAKRVTAVIPYLCYSRSDKKDKPRVPITARLIADMIEIAGADHYITLDLHAGQIQGFFSISGDVLTAFHILKEYIYSLLPNLKDPVVVTADLGFSKKGRNFATAINTPLAFIEKRRVGKDNSPTALTLIGQVKNRDLIIVDDEVDTGGTMVQAVELAKQQGANQIYLTFVHPIFSPPAVQRLSNLPITQIITTDTVPISNESKIILGNRLKILSIAPLLGEVIMRANDGRSVGQMFNE